VVLIALITAANAQPAEPEAPPPTEDTRTSPEDDEAEEVLVDPIEQAPSAELVVYGERLVDQARREVVETLEDLGYDYEVKSQGDRTIYRHPAAWYGEVVVHDDGWVQVKRQRIRVEGRAVPWAKRRGSVGAWLGCFVYPWGCIRVYGATVSRRKWMGTQTRTVADLQPKVERLGDRIADLETMRRVAELPARLEALWDHGTPLTAGAPVLATRPERRRAILEHWGTRTDTEWGRRVRETIMNFVVAVIQDGPDAFIQSEITAFNAGRADRIELPTGSSERP